MNLTCIRGIIEVCSPRVEELGVRALYYNSLSEMDLRVERTTVLEADLSLGVT